MQLPIGQGRTGGTLGMAIAVLVLACSIGRTVHAQASYGARPWLAAELAYGSATTDCDICSVRGRRPGLVAGVTAGIAVSSRVDVGVQFRHWTEVDIAEEKNNRANLILALASFHPSSSPMLSPQLGVGYGAFRQSPQVRADGIVGQIGLEATLLSARTVTPTVRLAYLRTLGISDGRVEGATSGSRAFRAGLFSIGIGVVFR